MIPFLPETPVSSGTLSGAGGAVMSQTGATLREGGTALDFAGLLDAAMPAAVTLVPGGGLPETTPDGPAAGADPVLTAPLPPAAEILRELPALISATPVPGGTILPVSGENLPDEAMAPIAATATISVVMQAPDAFAADGSAPAQPPSSSLPQVPAVPVPAEDSDTAESAPASVSETHSTDEAAPALAVTGVPTAPIAPTPPILAAALSAAAPAAASALARSTARAGLHPAALPSEAENAPMPERAALLAEADDAPSSSPSPASSPPTPHALPLADAPAAAQPAPSSAPAVPLATAPAATPAPAERNELRAPSTNQESTIAAVGEIREALRAARPEMTLRHAEFGFVSLRLEPMMAGQQDWRAVLASRDPGFVPAIQAALAERAVSAAAATDSAGTGTGTNMGQNGTSDQRYGSSPNGGQGSSQPYMGHSPDRDEGGSAPRNGRQPNTTDAVAGRAGDADAEQTDPGKRGVFA